MKPRRLTLPAVSAALRQLVDARAVSHEALAKLMASDAGTVSRMLSDKKQLDAGRRLTLVNVDSMLRALGYSWPDLFATLDGDFQPSTYAANLHELSTLVRELREENRALKAARR